MKNGYLLIVHMVAVKIKLTFSQRATVTTGPGLNTDAWCEWPRSQHRRLVRVAQVSTPTLGASGPGVNTDAWCEWPRCQHRRFVRVAQVSTPTLCASGPGVNTITQSCPRPRKAPNSTYRISSNRRCPRIVGTQLEAEINTVSFVYGYRTVATG